MQSQMRQAGCRRTTEIQSSPRQAGCRPATETQSSSWQAGCTTEPQLKDPFRTKVAFKEFVLLEARLLEFCFAKACNANLP